MLEKLSPKLQTDQLLPFPAMPSLEQVIYDLNPFSREALFLGVASDGLPILLILNNSTPGPLHVAGDTSSGKTALIQVIACTATMMHVPNNDQSGLVKNVPEECKSFREMSNYVGVFPTYQNKAIYFISGLTDWVHSNRGGRHSILLLLDDLESMMHADFEARQILRWLLLHGPEQQVWPVAILNTGLHAKVSP